MRSTPTAGRDRATTGSNRPVAHRPSHVGLLRDRSAVQVPTNRSRHGRLDAIIVPATRPASALAGVIDLAAATGTTLVVLCSGRQATVDRIAERVEETVGARGIVARIDNGYVLPEPFFETSSFQFATASAGRRSDLSLKRNVGLLLARMQGWRKVVFVDDDITLLGHDLARLGHQLNNHQIAGMACRNFPDNSVFCHARRLAKIKQDVFVTGAVLGVNCGDLPLPFFPDVYNEDWFFFADAAAHRRLVTVGNARQARYEPFARASRAAHEEFGDLLAEGLYSLIEDPPVSVDRRRPAEFLPTLVAMADGRYWESAIQGRRTDLRDTLHRLKSFTGGENCSDEVVDAIASLAAAEKRYEEADTGITAELCVEFLDAWRRDLRAWNRVYQRTNSLLSADVALKELGLATSVVIP